MSNTLKTLATSSASPRGKRVVVSYAHDLHEHEFTKLGADGKTKIPTGETGYAFRVLPQAADGSVSGVGLWIWLDDPTALRAFLRSVRGIAAAAAELNDAMVAAGDWPAEPKPVAPKPVAAPTPPPAAPKSTLAKLAGSKAEAAAAKAQALDDGLEDLPF